MCLSLGDLEILYTILTTLLIIIIIFLLLRSNFIKTIFTHVISKTAKKDFYECGLKPISQHTPTISIQYFTLAVFFILYDSELLFVLPLLTVADTLNFVDFLLLTIYLFLLIFSLIVDFNKNVLTWQL